MTDHVPHHNMTTTTGTNHSPFITDTARKDASIGLGHITDSTTTEAPATTRGIHPTPHPTTTAAHDTNPPIDALGDTLTGIH